MRLTKGMAIITVLLIIYHFAVRDWMLEWGAPERISTMSLPGDSLCDAPFHTRAIYINATPQTIWPWIVQMGQDRGGFYSYSFLENLFLADMKNEYLIKPELQTPRHAGDTIWLASNNRYSGMGHQIIALTQPMQSLVMTNGGDYAEMIQHRKGSGTWSFYLYPEKEGTWLIARSAYRADPLRYMFYELPHFIMEQKTLRTIKQLSEQ